MNKAILIGNLGRDPEINNTQNGTTVAKFSIATSEKWRDNNTGEMQERTEWHRITAFADLLKYARNTFPRVGKFALKAEFRQVHGKEAVLQDILLR